MHMQLKIFEIKTKEKNRHWKKNKGAYTDTAKIHKRMLLCQQTERT